MPFLRTLRHWLQHNGSQSIVNFDESGLSAHAYRPHGWAKRGVKLHGVVLYFAQTVKIIRSTILTCANQTSRATRCKAINEMLNQTLLL